MDRQSTAIVDPQGGHEATVASARTRKPKSSVATRLFGYDMFIAFAPLPWSTWGFSPDFAHRLQEDEVEKATLIEDLALKQHNMKRIGNIRWNTCAEGVLTEISYGKLLSNVPVTPNDQQHERNIRKKHLVPLQAYHVYDDVEPSERS